MRADINDLKRMMSELLHNPCQEPVRDIKALLPTTAQSSAPVYAAGSVPVFAESEEVTDEPPRAMTKADMQREQIIRGACAATTDAAAKPPPSCSCPSARSTARSRSWASKRLTAPL